MLRELRVCRGVVESEAMVRLSFVVRRHSGVVLRGMKNPDLVEWDEAGVGCVVHPHAAGGKAALLCQACQSRGGLVGHEDAHARDRQ